MTSKALPRAWVVVGASALGIMVSPGALVFYSFGVFLRPIAAATGWSMADITFALTVFTGILTFCIPVVGALIDRLGVRVVLFPSIVLFGLALASVKLATTLAGFYYCFAALALLGAGANSIGYMRAVCSWFRRSRGLAVGVAQSGMGLSVMVMPALCQYLLVHGDWRFAYAMLGIIVVAIGLPAAVFVRENPSLPREVHPQVSFEVSSTGGALRSARYWKLLAAFFLLSAAINSTAVHLVPLMERAGSGSERAVLCAAVFGGSMSVGRLVIAPLLDRYFAPGVAAVVFLTSAAGILALAAGAAGAGALIAAAAIGLSAGADGDLLSYLVSRYFGIREFAALSGLIFSAYLIAASVFPWLTSLSVAHAGSYTPALLGSALLCVASAVLMLRLGPFPGKAPSVETVGSVAEEN